MTLTATRCATAVCVILCVSSALAQGPNTLDSEKAQRVAELLAPKATLIEAPQVKIEADPSQAAGLTFKNEGILVVPKKGLKEKEKEDNAAVNTKQGAGFAYLFMSQAFCPVVEGKPAKADVLRTVRVVDGRGNERTVTCLLLAVRRIDDEDWRMYVYGAKKEPLVDAQFDEAERPNSGPVAIDVENAANNEGTLAVTVFGKYKAGFAIAYQR